MQFKTRYGDRKETEGITFVEPSLTIQSEFKSTTVDYYLQRYSATGLLGDPNRAVQAQFGDFSELQDFQTSQNLIARTKEQFDSLPSGLRAQFDHNVNTYVEFLLDPANKEKAIELGLMNPEKKAVEPEVQVPVQPIEQPSMPSVTIDETTSTVTQETTSAQFSS